jgi:ketosteroid isomerase-like protein
MKLLLTSIFLLISLVETNAQSTWQAPTHTRARRVYTQVKTINKPNSKPVTQATPVKFATAKKEIENLEHEWAQALLDENVAKLEIILSDNLQYTRSNGKVENKDGYLKTLRDGTTNYSLIKRDNSKIIINGETAIVTARWKARLQNKPNPPLETTARYTHVYVKKDGRWQLTTHQSTEIK